MQCAPRPAFVDYNLPDGFGTILVSRLKITLSDVYVVLMTAQPTPEVVNEAFGCGANSFLPKPFDIEAMSRLIMQYKNE